MPRPRGRPRKVSVPVEQVPAVEAEPVLVAEPPKVARPAPLAPPGVQLRFDSDARARILECPQVYLVCKKSAQDKTVHRAEWLKDLV